MKVFITTYFFLIITIFVLPAQQIELKQIATYHTGVFNGGATEILAYDHRSKRVFSTNGFTGSIDILDFSNPEELVYIKSIDLSPYGIGANSVAAHNGLIVAAVENENKQAAGKAVFFDADGNYLGEVPTGPLPDHVIFSPNGRIICIANEGEPNDDYTIDPEGSVTLVYLPKERYNLNSIKVKQLNFKQFNEKDLDASIRVTANPGNSTVAQDLEPEYIAVSPDNKKAFVTCQENNALIIIDLEKGKIKDLVGLGFKNHNLPNNGFDSSDTIANIDIRSQPALGMYQPDAIAAYQARGRTYLVTVNEGDSRDYLRYSEEAMVKDLALNPAIFPNAAVLQKDENLGRLTVSTVNGDADQDGLYEQIYAFGARSFSIWNESGNQIYDSGDDFEQITAQLIPEGFNASNDNNIQKNRSNDKGPEPETVDIAKIGRATYAFIGLERVGGIMVYNISNPYFPYFVCYLNNRDFSEPIASTTAGDLGPEKILHIPLRKRHGITHYILVANEVSGTISVYRVINNRFTPFNSLAYKKLIPQPVNLDTQLPPTNVASSISPIFKVRPTLVKEQIQFNGTFDITVFDMLGHKLIEAVNVNQLDLSALNEGMYLIVNEKGISQQIVKTK